MSLAFDITHNDSVVIFSLTGRINNQEETTPILEKLDLELNESKKEFIYNLENLDYITSSGLNFFLRSMTRIRNVDGELVFCSVNSTVNKLFKISKLNEIFSITDSVTEGIKKLELNKLN